MADRYAKADELLKTLQRHSDPYPMRDADYDIVAEMDPNADGPWVKFEDLRDLLHRSVDEALMRREP